MFKKQYDIAQAKLVEAFKKDSISLNQYNNGIKQIRDTLREKTEGN